MDLQQIARERQLNFVKDMKSGQLDVLVKNKDIDRAIKGIADIELYDSEGALLKRAKTENLITNQAIFDMFYMQFINRKALGQSSFLGSPFGAIYLTNHNGEEDASIPMISGDVVGYADFHVPISTVNTKQGTVVPEDCSMSPTEFKFVTEFNISKANGTFNTLWVGASLPDPTSTENHPDGLGYSIRNVEALDGQYAISYPTVVVKDDLVYAFNNNTAYVYTINMFAPRKTLLHVSTITLDRALNGAINSAIWIPELNEFWFSSGVGNLIQVYDQNLVWKREETSVVAKMYQMAYAKGYVFGAVFDTNTMFIMNVQTKEVVEVALDLNGKKIYEITSDARGNYLYITASTSPTGIMTEFIYFINEDGTLTLLSYNYNTDSFQKAGILLGNEQYFIAEVPFLYKSYIEPGTMTKLASAITKEQGMSMRVSYTFQFA